MARPDQRAVVIVTGMHRSGTTFSGEILGRSPGAVYLHEPFNPRYGLARVRAEYPYIDPEVPGGYPEIVSLFDDAVNLRARYRRRHRGDSPGVALARALVGGEAGWRQWRGRARRMGGAIDTVVVKDPYLTLAVGGLLAIEPGTEPYAWAGELKAVCLVRHPMAVWRSIQRMDWGVRFANFGGPAMEARLAEEGLPSPEDLARRPVVERMGYLWLLLHRDLVARRVPGLLVVRHEDLATHPFQWFTAMASHCDLELDASVQREISERTTGSIVEVRGGQLHEHRRNSGEIAWSWLNQPIDDEERVIAGMTEELVASLYGEWRPHLRQG